MAIAAWDLDRYEHDCDELPWPRPTLVVVGAPSAPDAWGAEEPWTGVDGAAVAAIGADVSAHRRQRSSARVRRRRLAAGALVAGTLVALALPLSALGGRAAPTKAGSVPTGGTVYVVQPGDTLWSIASRVDGGGDPRPLAEALAKETGSTVVVPGERIVIP